MFFSLLSLIVSNEIEKCILKKKYYYCSLNFNKIILYSEYKENKGAREEI